MMNDVGARIRKIREEKGLSQESMAMELEITQSNYGRLEKGDNRLTVPKLKLISEILKISIAYLFDEKNPKTNNQHNCEISNVCNVNTILNADKEHIKTLKDEISFLRDLVKN